MYSMPLRDGAWNGRLKSCSPGAPAVAGEPAAPLLPMAFSDCE